MPRPFHVAADEPSEGHHRRLLGTPSEQLSKLCGETAADTWVLLPEGLPVSVHFMSSNFLPLEIQVTRIGWLAEPGGTRQFKISGFVRLPDGGRRLVSASHSTGSNQGTLTFGGYQLHVAETGT